MKATTATDSDRALVLECQRSWPAISQAPFRDLYDRYKKRIHGICHRLTGNLHDAQDASQETFATVFRRLHSFRFEAVFATWVHRIAVNVCIDLRRRIRTRPSVSFELLARSHDPDGRRLNFPDDRAPMPFEPAALRELHADVDHAIRGLSSKLREVVMLRYFEDLSYEEIGARQGISIGTVKSRLFRAHAALGYWLQPTLSRHSA